MDVIDIFKLPASCVQNIRLTKKELRDFGNLLKGDDDIIDYYIDSMMIEGIISSDRINIPQYKKGSIDYPYFMILTVNIKFKEMAVKTADFIQRVIPNHILLILKYENEIMFNCALKELKDDGGSILIKDAIRSPWVDIENPDGEEQKFLHSMELNMQSFDNLYKTYKDFYTKINHSKLISIMGFYPDHVFQEDYDFNPEISAIEEISSTIEGLYKEKEKEYSHQKKMECYMKIKTYEKRMKEIEEKIRGQYNGQT